MTDVGGIPSPRAKKVTRAFKIAENLDDVLIQHSEKSGITPSSFINNLLIQYFDWWQFAQKRGSFMVLDRRLIRAIIEEVDDDTSVDIARSVAVMMSREFMMSRFGKVDKDSIFRFLEMLDNNMNWGEMTPTKTEGGKLEVMVKHDLGVKWSLFVSEFISSLFSSFLAMKTTSEFSTFGCSITAFSED
jgi:hypothetical protein